MTVRSSAVGGITAMPYSGTPRCGYMRFSHHSCPDSSCPLKNSMVMVFSDSIGGAIESCHRLWSETPEDMMLVQRLTVATETMTLDSKEIEAGLVAGDPTAWTHFRNRFSEFDDEAVRLPNIDALISFPNSPASIWQMQGAPLPLPWNVEVRRAEDEFWRGLDPVERLIAEALAEDDPGEGGFEPSGL